MIGVNIMCSVKIIDMPMGYGKTNGIIAYMNEHPERHYLFITPYLEEGERIKKGCPELKFKSPNENYVNKSVHLEKLIAEGQNIASTHSLFSLMSERARKHLKAQDYVLVLDEELNTIWTLKESQRDIELITNSLCSVEENTGLLKWVREENSYKGKFSDTKKYIEVQNVYSYNKALIGVIHPELFTECFTEIFILTYLFKYSNTNYYFKIYNIEYEYYYFAGQELQKGLYDDRQFRNLSKNLITVFEHSKINQIGEDRAALSKSWFKSSKKNAEHKILKNNLKNYYTNLIKSSSEERLWSTFSDYKRKYTGNGYHTAFLECNCRASNEYRNACYLAYLLNIYANPILKQWFYKHGITYSNDYFALSMLIQWVWRSCIRDGKEIVLYLPSKRMRELLAKWQDNAI